MLVKGAPGGVICSLTEPILQESRGGLKSIDAMRFDSTWEFYVTDVHQVHEVHVKSLHAEMFYDSTKTY